MSTNKHTCGLHSRYNIVGILVECIGKYVSKYAKLNVCFSRDFAHTTGYYFKNLFYPCICHIINIMLNSIWDVLCIMLNSPNLRTTSPYPSHLQKSKSNVCINTANAVIVRGVDTKGGYTALADLRISKLPKGDRILRKNFTRKTLFQTIFQTPVLYTIHTVQKFCKNLFSKTNFQKPFSRVYTCIETKTYNVEIILPTEEIISFDKSFSNNNYQLVLNN